MAKVQIKSEKLTPFGGIFSIMEQFDSMISPIIDHGSQGGSQGQVPRFTLSGRLTCPL